MAGIEWNNDDFSLERTRLYFTRFDETLYVCMPAEPGQHEEYLFGEIKLDSEKAYVWGPDVDFFVRQVESGALKGSVDKNKHTTSVLLEAPARDILELISTNQAAIDYRNPLIIRKLK
jgi:hypothetical protein